MLRKNNAMVFNLWTLGLLVSGARPFSIALSSRKGRGGGRRFIGVTSRDRPGLERSQCLRWGRVVVRPPSRVVDKWRFLTSLGPLPRSVEERSSKQRTVVDMNAVVSPPPCVSLSPKGPAWYFALLALSSSQHFSSLYLRSRQGEGLDEDSSSLRGGRGGGFHQFYLYTWPCRLKSSCFFACIRRRWWFSWDGNERRVDVIRLSHSSFSDATSFVYHQLVSLSLCSYFVAPSQMLPLSLSDTIPPSVWTLDIWPLCETLPRRG